MSTYSNSWHQREMRKFKKAYQLLPPCIHETGGVWADMGCREGVFTAVLHESLGKNSEIYAIDKNAWVLRALKRNFTMSYPEANLHPIRADFIQPLPLPSLDGLVLANALHFVPDKQKVDVIKNLAENLKPDGTFILIEYNSRLGNLAVPFPLSQGQFLELAQEIKFRNPQIVARAPSSFMGELYAAITHAP
jgi:trans-aconitate methyltransferase